MTNLVSMTAKAVVATAAAVRVPAGPSVVPAQPRIGVIRVVGRMWADMTDETPAMPDGDTSDLERELQSFRAGLNTRDMVLAGAVIGVVTIAVLIKLLTGWPHFRIFGEEQLYWFLIAGGQAFGTMMAFTIRVHLGYDDLDDDDDGIGGANGSW
jgi:hypothetical protein